MRENKLTKRKIQAINTREQIFQTSIELIGKKGYDNVSINEICKEIGMSVGAFYHHFSGKEDIIVEAYKEFDMAFENFSNESTKISKAIDKIIEIIKYQVEYADKIGLDIIRQVYKSQLFAGREFFISEERTLPRILLEIVEEAQKNDELTEDLSSKEITRQLLRLSRGIIYDWCVHDGVYDIVKEALGAVEHFLLPLKN
jgi:AcrR family transcriptional regulator